MRAPTLLTAACVAALAVATPSAATPVTTSVSAPTTATPPTRVVDLDGDSRPASRPATREQAATWPRGSITYYETIPRRWQWGLDRAVEHWNHAGGGVHFTKVSSRSRARVLIGYGRTGGADGLGGWKGRDGRITSGFVHLSRHYQHVDERDDQQRVWVGILLAHELGHVLGFEHTRQQCSLMAPTFHFGTCGPLSDDHPGYYRCRWVDPTLLARFIDRYGGHARRPAAECLTYPLPRRLENVRFSGGAGADGGSRVRIRWRKLDHPAAGTRIRVELRDGSSCRTGRYADEIYLVKPGRTEWVDPAYDGGPTCFSVQPFNRSGAASARVKQVLVRVAA